MALGRRRVLVGSLALTAIPLLAVLRLQPGSVPFFVAAAFAGMLIYTSRPIKVVVAQDLAPHAPAAAAGIILGATAGLAGALYITLGRCKSSLASLPE